MVRLLGLVLVLGTLLATSGTPTDAGPPGGVTLYGTTFPETDFVWCIDRSCSMSWGSVFEGVKAEVSNAINQLQPPQRFSLVSFSDNWSAWSVVPMEATPQNKAAGIAWLQGIIPTGTTCVAPAVVSALGIVELSPTLDRAVLFIGDGEPSCDTTIQTLNDVITANTEDIPIHSFFVGAPDPAGRSFVMQLASDSGGTFVDTTLGASQFRRGDMNDDGETNLTDAVTLLSFLFAGGPLGTCPDAGDANADGELALDDSVVLLTYLFANGPAPTFPGPDQCGAWTPGGISSCIYASCP